MPSGLSCFKFQLDLLSQLLRIARVTPIEMRDTVFNALVGLIKKIEAETIKNPNNTKLMEARKYHRDAQFLFDFIEAENSTGFHAPHEASRIFIKSLDTIRKGEDSLR